MSVLHQKLGPVLVPAPKVRATPRNFVVNGFLFTCDILKAFFVVVVQGLRKLHL